MTATKTVMAGILVASTMAFAMPTPASAIGVVIGPRGGVGVRLGAPGWHRGWHRGWNRPLVTRGWHRGWHRGWRR